MLRRALTPDEPGANWTLTEHLLALIHDQLAVANWQRAGGRKSKRPKPISPLLRRPVTKYGQTSRTPEEVKAYLAQFGPPPS